MKSHISREFRRAFAELPKDIQTLARDAYRVFEVNPAHPSLKFKKFPPFEDIWSARINAGYRVLGNVAATSFFGSSSGLMPTTTRSMRGFDGGGRIWNCVLGRPLCGHHR